MFRSVVTTMAVLFMGTFAHAQLTFQFDATDVSKLDANLTAIFQMYDARGEELKGSIKAIAAKVEEMGLTVCHIKKWAEEWQSYSSSRMTLLQSINDKLLEHERLLKSTADALRAEIDENVKTRAQLWELAKRVAANELSETKIKEEVIPLVRKSLAESKDVSDELGKLKIAMRDYALTSQSLCQRMAAMEAWRQQVEQQTRSSLKPVVPASATAPAELQPIAAAPVQLPPPMPYHPNLITADGPNICKRSVVKMHYDYQVLETQNGVQVVVKYHGNLYRSCSGSLILVLH